MKELLKSKTFWTGIAGLIGAIGGAASGEMTINEAIQLGIPSLMGIFIRAGINKAGK